MIRFDIAGVCIGFYTRDNFECRNKAFGNKLQTNSLYHNDNICLQKQKNSNVSISKSNARPDVRFH